MNTIKNLIGSGLLLIISVIFASCGSDYEECPFYDVVVSNNYFEPLDSVCFNNTTIIDVEITKQHTFNNVPHGKQTIQFYTKSKLEISADIYLLGDTERVYVELTESGRICLEKNDSLIEMFLPN